MANSLNKINSGGIKDDSIVNADIKSDAAIAGSKISPVFTSNASVTGTLSISDVIKRGAADSSLSLSGSTASNAGANLLLYGESHASHANKLRFRQGSTDKFTIDANGKVGIGETSPDEILHINSGTANGVLKLESTDTGADIYIKDSGGEVGISASGDNLLFRTTSSSTERMRIDSSGNVGIATTSGGGKLAILSNSSTYEGLELQTPASDGTGEFHIGVHESGTGNGRSIVFKRGGSDGMDTESMRIQASGGISFNGDTAAANALSDYEEGTWSPDFYYHSSVSNVAGHYTKIGRMVYAYFTGTIYSSQSDQERIENLPFTTINVTGGSGGVARGYQNFDIQNGPIYYIEENTTKVHFYKDNGTAMPASDLNGKTVRGMAVYTAA